MVNPRPNDIDLLYARVSQWQFNVFLPGEKGPHLAHKIKRAGHKDQIIAAGATQKKLQSLARVLDNVARNPLGYGAGQYGGLRTARRWHSRQHHLVRERAQMFQHLPPVLILQSAEKESYSAVF